MDLNDSIKSKILEAIRIKGLSKTDLAKQMRLGNSWVTKLLKPVEYGGLKSLSDQQVELLQEFLGIEFYVQIASGLKVSQSAHRLSEKAESNQELQTLLDSLDRLTESGAMTPRFFETQEVIHLGEDLIRLVFENEDKAGKVGREALRFVTETKEESEKRRLKERRKKRPTYKGKQEG